MGHGDEPRLGPNRRGQGRQGPLVVPAVADVGDVERDAEPISNSDERPETARMFLASRDDSVARAPVDRPRGDVHSLGRRASEGYRFDISGEDGRDARPGFGQPLEERGVGVLVGASGPDLPAGELIHRGGGLGR